MYVCLKLKKIVMIFLSAIFIFIVFCFTGKAVLNAVEIPSAIQKDGVFVPIIMYHSVLNNDAANGDYVISNNILESDMKYLKENGYTSIFVQDLISYVYDDVPLPENPVILTFDDGFYNNLAYVLPLLKEYDMKGVFSIVGSYAEKFSQINDKNTSYAYLTWDDIAELARSGYIEIGNHTFNMHGTQNRRGCTKKWEESLETYSKVFDDDILNLQKMLTEKSGVTPLTFTYPYGFISDESIPLLKDIGFKASLSCYEKPNYITKDPDILFELNRYNRKSGISTEKFMKKVLAK